MDTEKYFVLLIFYSLFTIQELYMNAQLMKQEFVEPFKDSFR